MSEGREVPPRRQSLLRYAYPDIFEDGGRKLAIAGLDAGMRARVDLQFEELGLPNVTRLYFNKIRSAPNDKDKVHVEFDEIVCPYEFQGFDGMIILTLDDIIATGGTQLRFNIAMEEGLLINGEPCGVPLGYLLGAT